MKKIGFIVIGIIAIASYMFIANGQSKNCEVGNEEVLQSKVNKDVVIIDVRTPQEYQSGHLEGALLMDIKSSSFTSQIEKLDKEKEYLVYCKTGMRSSYAQNIMQKKGFKSVCNIKGGIVNMQKQGVKLVR